MAKLIPAEVVGLHPGGKNAIEAYFQAATRSQESPTGFWIGWTVLCVLGLLIYRA
ncbi:hypothetical protein [Xanthobacter sp. KR7-225]|uniref:hypothetical protein n=1 Tax=Xanthobacter sp. KR7-225 TaxID=3156613 RepID=UPI0032B484FA